MNYVALTSPDINNGLGCRVTLWIAGCHHKCEGCHNEWLQNYAKGKPLIECKNDLYKILDSKHIKGLTLSGGDPLDQPDLSVLLDFLKQLKKDYPSKDIWLYTGFTYEQILADKDKLEILNECDWLVEGKFILAQRDTTLAFRGSPNQRIYHKVDDTFEQLENPETYFKEI